MIFQSMALKLEATTDSRKIELFKLVRKTAFALIFGGIADLLAVTILMWASLWVLIPKA